MTDAPMRRYILNEDEANEWRKVGSRVASAQYDRTRDRLKRILGDANWLVIPMLYVDCIDYILE
jgi:hypothetical protein